MTDANAAESIPPPRPAAPNPRVTPFQRRRAYAIVVAVVVAAAACVWQARRSGHLPAAAGSVAAGEPITLRHIADALAPCTCPVDVVALKPTTRQAELVGRLQTAVSADRRWFLDHVRKAAPGRPLDYDPRLGLSRAEYNEYLRLAEDVRLEPVDHFDLGLEWWGRDNLRFNAPRKYAVLNELVLNVRTGNLSTRFGPTSDMSPTGAVARNLGPWSGLHWKHEDVDAGTGVTTVYRLSIGKLAVGGGWLLEYGDGMMVGDAAASGAELLLVLHPSTGAVPR